VGWREYLGEADTAVHAAAIQALGEWIPGVMDRSANGRDETDGRRMIQMYRKLGLSLTGMENAMESGVLEVWETMPFRRPLPGADVV
jgi:hypothetical protein